MKYKQLRPGFQLRSSCRFPPLITTKLTAPMIFVGERNKTNNIRGQHDHIISQERIDRSDSIKHQFFQDVIVSVLLYIWTSGNFTETLGE